MKPIQHGLEGSGLRAMESSEEALAEAKAELAGLQAKMDLGENVEVRAKQLRDLIEKLKADQGMINSAGM